MGDKVWIDWLVTGHMTLHNLAVPEGEMEVLIIQP